MKKIAENSQPDVQPPAFDNSWHKLLTEVRCLPLSCLLFIFIEWLLSGQHMTILPIYFQLIHTAVLSLRPGDSVIPCGMLVSIVVRLVANCSIPFTLLLLYSALTLLPSVFWRACVRACVTLQCNRLQHLSGLWCCYFCQMLAGIMFWPVCVSKVTQKVEWIFLKVGEQVMIHHRGVNSILEVIGNIFWALVCHICHHTTTDGLHIEPGDFVDCTPAAVLVQWSVQY